MSNHGRHVKGLHLAYICGNPTYTVDSPSGYATRMRELCRGFESLGFETSIHLPAGAAERIARAASGKRALLKRIVPRRLWETLKDVYRLRVDCRFDRELPSRLSRPPDVIYECLEFPGSVTRHLRRSCRGTYVLEIHGPLEEDAELTAGPQPLRSVFARRVRAALEKADLFVVVSGVVRDWLTEESVPRDRVVVVPNGADLVLFDPERFVKQPRRDVTVIGFVGSDLAWHRLDALIRAFALLPAEPPVRLQIVGMASENAVLRRLAAESGAGDRIFFLGPIAPARIPDAIAGFDICVMPGSNRYGSPIKIFEYGAMGKAIVAPDVAPVREVLTDGYEGILIPSGDIEAIRGALLRLVGNPELRRKLGQSFQARVRSRYGWTHVARSIADRILAVRGAA